MIKLQIYILITYKIYIHFKFFIKITKIYIKNYNLNNFYIKF